MRDASDHVTKLEQMNMALWDMGAQIANYTLHAALMSSGTSGYQAKGQKRSKMPARQLSGFLSLVSSLHPSPKPSGYKGANKRQRHARSRTRASRVSIGLFESAEHTKTD